MSVYDRAVRWLRLLISYLLIFAIAAFVANLWLTRNQASGVAPELGGVQIGGDRTQVDFQRFEQPVVVYFFAEWCPICALQHSAIRALSKDYPVLGVAMQSGPASTVETYMRENALDFAVLNDPQGSISRRYGVQGVPAAFVVKPDGEVAYSLRGYSTEPGLRLRLWLAEYF